jgi:hypothetical protein
MALEKQVMQLRKENHQLKRVHGYNCASSEEESRNVLKQIQRSGSGHPIGALQSLEPEEFLTEEHIASPGPTEISNDAAFRPAGGLIIQIQALPWSVVATDQVVSELISRYFTFDYLYVFPPIPRSTFVNEMRLGDVDAAGSCSPLLVNAICAQQCVSSGAFCLGLSKYTVLKHAVVSLSHGSYRYRVT